MGLEVATFTDRESESRKAVTALTHSETRKLCNVRANIIALPLSSIYTATRISHMYTTTE